MRNSEVPLRVVLACVYADKPLSVTQIARKANLPRQIISYHIPRLVGDGLLLPVEQGRTLLYSPQHFFVDDKVFSQITELMGPIIKKVSENLIVTNKEDAERVLRNNFFLLLSVLGQETQRK